MKRNYEALLILNTKGKESDVESTISQLSSQIEAEGARLTQIDQLGRKEFAYPSNHLDHGFYVSIKFEADPSAIAPLRTKLKFNHSIHLQHYSRID